MTVHKTEHGIVEIDETNQRVTVKDAIDGNVLIEFEPKDFHVIQYAGQSLKYWSDSREEQRQEEPKPESKPIAAGSAVTPALKELAFR